MKLSLILVLFFSFSSWAKTDRRGERGCNFSKAKKTYEQDSKDLGNQYTYAACLVIKGEDINGLARLYHLADYQSSVSASFFLAEYLGTDGRFRSPATEKNLDEAIQYYLHTQAIIALIPNYPEPDYFFHERNYQIELYSVFYPSELYLWKYRLGTLGDYTKHLLQSPSYQGNRTKTHPKYNTLMRDSLNKAVYHAEQCANLPQKRHFDPKLYKATIEVCHLIKELALTLMPLEKKRQEILQQAHCKDLNRDNCPEYYETHWDIENQIRDYVKVASNIFHPDKEGSQTVALTTPTSATQ